VWTACINPPSPPNNSHVIVKNYVKDQEIAIGDTVVYGCEIGHFFIVDYYLPSFELECSEDGLWETPAADEWKTCVDPNGSEKATEKLPDDNCLRMELHLSSLTQVWTTLKLE